MVPPVTNPLSGLPVVTSSHGGAPEGVRAELRAMFGIEFSLFDSERGETVYRAPDGLHPEKIELASICREVARRGSPELVADEDPLVVLAVPLGEDAPVAVGAFLTRALQSDSEIDTAATALGLERDTARRWARAQTPWPADAPLRMSRLWVENRTLRDRGSSLADEVEKVSTHLLTTYEEISLLHHLTRNLTISKSDRELAEMALEWLSDVVPVETLVIHLREGQTSLVDDSGPRMLCRGACPLSPEEVTSLIHELGNAARTGPVVINPPTTNSATWAFPTVHSLVSVPLLEGRNVFGWLLAINHREGASLGTVEASLLASVGHILGIHSGNQALYRRQSEFLANVVRALTSAIDAKDPYTCGHSDRVARVSVRLARELGCNDETLNTIYMAGLLHDIGKIGIDDDVLRCPGKLTAAQYDHIKLHPELGFNILKELKPLEKCLPIVLHHHEAWDGGGYPFGLSGEAIPRNARIVAVADAYDAMSSDRPYRRGMDREKLDAIVREGRGKQWDAEVVDAFFRIRDEIERVAGEERETINFEFDQWT